MAAARGPVAAMPGEGRATRARTSGFFTIGKIDKNQIRERLGHFLAIFSKIKKLKKDSCFHVFFRGHAGGYRTFLPPQGASAQLVGTPTNNNNNNQPSKSVIL